jgi:Na+-translocating ferredoxin:NAD+ oxidoreductase RNF subunit RnfB
LFSVAEAEIACSMSETSLSATSIAEKRGKNERETYLLLKGMVRKGLIDIERGREGLHFKLIPFIVGFYERQNAQIDVEFAELFEQYYHEALHSMMSLSPSVQRIIPIEESIPLHVEVLPYQRASHYLDQAKSWGVLKCICRVQKGLIGEGCDHTVENCLALSPKSGAFKRVEVIREISRDEAFGILTEASREGLVHSTRNTQEGIDYICNCCSCCCGLLRGIIEYKNLNAVGKSDYLASVEENLCSGCSACVERCQFNALEVIETLCKVDADRCFGCGLCVPYCPENALSLKQKPSDSLQPPPLSESEWRQLRAKARESS